MYQNKKEVPQKKTSHQKQTQAERFGKITMRASESARLKEVFLELCALEEEKSSDEESSEKVYKKRIEERANAKKMKTPTSHFVSKTMQAAKMLEKQTYRDEDDDDSQSIKEEKPKKFSIKALRKTMRKLCDEYVKEDLQQMIWEVDDDIDGYVAEKEFTIMYKRGISDEREEEPKKLFHLVEFLMFDKDDKQYITVEDTLEILCVRNPSGIDTALDNIFTIEEETPQGNSYNKFNKNKNLKGNNNSSNNIPSKKHEKMNYLEYASRMHKISMHKRDQLSNRKKIFCEKVQSEALKEKEF